LTIDNTCTSQMFHVNGW